MASTVPARRSNGNPPQAGALAKREPAREGAKSTAGLVKDAVTDAVDMMQSYVQLALVEVREDAQAAAKVAVGFAVGAVLGVMMLGFLCAAIVLVLEPVLPLWQGCLCVAGGLGLIAVIAIGLARRKLARHDFTPEETIAGLQEDAAWMAKKLS
jgi:uncharacterized membrane protein YqjE